MTVAHLGSQMTADEFADWRAFYALEGEVHERNDLESLVQHELTQARRE